jgi:hypothetical protein
VADAVRMFATFTNTDVSADAVNRSVIVVFDGVIATGVIAVSNADIRQP